jgi:pyruvate carboxylase
VRSAGKLCEAAICYTGDFLNPSRQKYNLKYYIDLARQLEKYGANLLAVKDMAGLCRPYATQQLIGSLKKELGIPVHFHTHDCSGTQIASLLLASEEGVDVVDCAMAPFSGMTSQPSLNALVETVRHSRRDTMMDFTDLQYTAEYWEHVRRFYRPFDGNEGFPNVEVYLHEMPGGQYSNLYQQAENVGLGKRWREVRQMYAEVNRLFGDIVKVTPTSKVVGDMAIFMVNNNLTSPEVVHGSREWSFPDSVVEFFTGALGTPLGGFPKELQLRILRGKKSLRSRQGAKMPPADLPAVRKELESKLMRKVTNQDIVSYLLFPDVSSDLEKHKQQYSDTSVLPTPTFFYGMAVNEEIEVEIEEGKTLFIKLVAVGEPRSDGKRGVFFELNGQPREVFVKDKSQLAKTRARPKIEVGNLRHVGAPMPGFVVQVAVAVGDNVEKGQKLMTLEAMKMETSLYANETGRVAEVLAAPRTQVETDDLLLRLE